MGCPCSRPITDCTWNELCTLKVENLSFHPLDKLLAPSIELSLKNLNVSSGAVVAKHGYWQSCKFKSENYLKKLNHN